MRRRTKVQLPDTAPWILRSKLVSGLLWLVIFVALAWAVVASVAVFLQ